MVSESSPASRSVVSEAKKVKVVLASLSTDFDAVLTLASFSTEPLPLQCLVDVLLEFENRQTRVVREVLIHAHFVETPLFPAMAD
ncbi:hypothetical protein PVK06_013211 [Gossypium arboreum]|uniref:Uncharacterized protein n=1 Tax=Gossypium arboreum TaxID=29729 RepID=A0ABR0QDK5_GOSAR|nr:hypothetical protein PVK06_013211 [Gossypium arboreum]